MFWLLCVAAEIIMIMELAGSKVDLHTMRLSLTASMSIPTIWTAWLMIQKFRFWWTHGVVRCCVKNCPADTNLRPVTFPLLGVKKLACEYHVEAVVNSHGQRGPVKRAVSHIREGPRGAPKIVTEDTAESKPPTPHVNFRVTRSNSNM